MTGGDRWGQVFGGSRNRYYNRARQLSGRYAYEMERDGKTNAISPQYVAPRSKREFLTVRKLRANLDDAFPERDTIHEGSEITAKELESRVDSSDTPNPKTRPDR